VRHIGPPLRIEDLGSANGTLVRSRPVEGGEETQRLWSAPSRPVELAAGDGLVLGFVAAVIRPAPASAPPRGNGGTEPVVADAAMQLVYHQAERAARGPIGMLILGETGVGKELLARFVHQRSPRAAGPFVGINCAALSESLLESELFGHERGAFTGAVQARPGLIETAHGGTLFLDEVGELPPAFQVKLLRVLEEQRVLRVGGRTPIAVDFRVVAATNRDLEADVARGSFRQASTSG
jgi:two-component system, NtrC family, response regulator AtoC